MIGTMVVDGAGTNLQMPTPHRYVHKMCKHMRVEENSRRVTVLLQLWELDTEKRLINTMQRILEEAETNIESYEVVLVLLRTVLSC